MPPRVITLERGVKEREIVIFPFESTARPKEVPQLGEVEVAVEAKVSFPDAEPATMTLRPPAGSLFHRVVTSQAVPTDEATLIFDEVVAKVPIVARTSTQDFQKAGNKAELEVRPPYLTNAVALHIGQRLSAPAHLLSGVVAEGAEAAKERDEGGEPSPSVAGGVVPPKRGRGGGRGGGRGSGPAANKGTQGKK